jgi:hypothetical protein
MLGFLDFGVPKTCTPVREISAGFSLVSDWEFWACTLLRFSGKKGALSDDSKKRVQPEKMPYFQQKITRKP